MSLGYTPFLPYCSKAPPPPQSPVARGRWPTPTGSPAGCSEPQSYTDPAETKWTKMKQKLVNTILFSLETVLWPWKWTHVTRTDTNVQSLTEVITLHGFQHLTLAESKKMPASKDFCQGRKFINCLPCHTQTLEALGMWSHLLSNSYMWSHLHSKTHTFNMWSHLHSNTHTCDLVIMLIHVISST